MSLWLWPIALCICIACVSTQDQIAQLPSIPHISQISQPAHTDEKPTSGSQTFSLTVGLLSACGIMGLIFGICLWRACRPSSRNNPKPEAPAPPPHHSIIASSSSANLQPRRRSVLASRPQSIQRPDWADLMLGNHDSRASIASNRSSLSRASDHSDQASLKSNTSRSYLSVAGNLYPVHPSPKGDLTVETNHPFVMQKVSTIDRRLSLGSNRSIHETYNITSTTCPIPTTPTGVRRNSNSGVVNAMKVTKKHLSKSRPLPPTPVGRKPSNSSFSSNRVTTLSTYPSKPSLPLINSTGLTFSNIETVRVPFTIPGPLHGDEINMHIGDQVRIDVSYSDNWVLGTNLTTNERGAFPLACFSDPEYSEYQAYLDYATSTDPYVVEMARRSITSMTSIPYSSSLSNPHGNWNNIMPTSSSSRNTSLIETDGITSRLAPDSLLVQEYRGNAPNHRRLSSTHSFSSRR